MEKWRTQFTLAQSRVVEKMYDRRFKREQPDVMCLFTFEISGRTQLGCNCANLFLAKTCAQFRDNYGQLVF